jgi:hypothetical protein
VGWQKVRRYTSNDARQFMLSTHSAVDGYRLGQQEPLVNATDRSNPQKAFFVTGDHQTNLVHVSG